MKIILTLIFIFLFLTLNNYIKEFPLLEIHRPLTLEYVFDELIRQEIKCSEIVFKQIKLETGNLKHVPHNNLFGFRTNKGYLKFDTWEDAVTYKKRWQERKYKGGDYYDFLRKVKYAEDKEYINKLKNM